MRRQDRMVTDINDIKSILNNTRIIHLGMTDGAYPYVLPLHFGYEFIDNMLHIYVHGYQNGKKFDLIKLNSHVFIEIDGDDEALVSGGDIPCKYSSTYSSVMGRGEATFLADVNKKIHGLQILMRHQTGREFTFTEAMVNSVGVVHIVVSDYTAKRRLQLTHDIILPPLAKK
ncbi:pyridoxamine 5'-phosphate oxidase family protein [Veillonella rodentium]|uniref:Predicted flavin-nucleotide-binding protein n=1 Tax=Veillonella rodentium TaxID=248315 RepID=A0A239ZUP1_9FIRM|nr:pyridoxamine 5'-phosphate oxidase family protein [Veillonella rodentium]SNV74483.1 Predicted flavin-nucleotide-binding protein [Veillonella rodentium]